MKHSTTSGMQAIHRGYTVIDLLAVVAAISVMLLEAAPAVGTVVNSARLAKISDRLVSQVGLAQSEAHRRHAPVVLCKSADGAACALSGGWEQGWMVFHDSNGNGALDPGEEVIARQHALPAPVKLRGDTNAARYISFAPAGQIAPGEGNAQVGTLTLCRQWNSGNVARQIVLDAVGPPHVRQLQLASCA